MSNLFHCGRMLILLLMAASLVACSAGSAKGGHGKPSSSSSSSSGNVTLSFSSSSSSSSGGETNCPAIDQPVCAVAPQVVMCKPGSIFCPIGFHKTFSSECAAIAAGASISIRAGECGELEGLDYSTPNCGMSAPVVCGTATDTAPCGTIPCPRVVYKTYGNVCELGAQRLLSPGHCSLEGTPVTQPLEMPCTADAPGACAKTTNNTVCYCPLPNPCV